MSLCLTACNKEVELGIEKEPIIRGKNNFHIGAERGSIETKIVNSFFWYSGYSRTTPTDTVNVQFKEKDSRTLYIRNDTIVFENLRLWTEDKKLKVELGANDLKTEKKFSFGLCKGNRYEGLSIPQDGRKD